MSLDAAPYNNAVIMDKYYECYRNATMTNALSFVKMRP